MPASNSGVQRVVSMSSSRSSKRPPVASASCWFSSAEQAWPRCSRPLGLGARAEDGRVHRRRKRVAPILTRLLLCRALADKGGMRRIVGMDDIAAGLDALCVDRPAPAAVRRMAGEVPLRLTEPGFASLASIIVSQQVSRASADAIFGRFVKLVDPADADRRFRRGEAVFREAGFAAEAAGDAGGRRRGGVTGLT